MQPVYITFQTIVLWWTRNWTEM